MQRFVINNDGPTVLEHLKNKKAIVKHISVQGKGKLHSCMLTFGKHGDTKASSKELLFIKPLHERDEILLPHVGTFNIADYDFCSLEIITGTLHHTDQIILAVLFV